jgi:ABC-type glycerol-3-phosphate transport system permease component
MAFSSALQQQHLYYREDKGTPVSATELRFERGAIRTQRAREKRYKPSGRPGQRRQRRASVVILTLLVFIGLFPYLYMLETSLKSNQQFNSSYWAPSFPFHFGNYSQAWTDVAPYLLSSLIVAACTMAGCCTLGSVTGYVLARFHFPGRQVFFGLIAVLLLVPGVATIIPLFIFMRDLNLLNTYPDLIIPQLASQTVLAVVLIKGYIKQVPQSLFDAAAVDGASATTIYRYVVLPLARPVIGTVALMSVISVWSEYFWPELTVTTNSLRTVPVGLQFFQGELTTSYGPLFAGYLIASVPLLLLFVFLSKYFLAGLQGGLVAEK